MCRNRKIKKMINAIIFSSDRAQRLRLLLQSIKENATDIFKLNIIYYSSTKEFYNGYKKLINENIIDGINWVHQSDNFKGNILELLKTDLPYSCFFTDDDVLYREVSYKDIESNINEDEDVFCFSLRLGNNTTYCYNMQTDNKTANIEEINNIIKWDWQKHYLDFGYPLCINGHIFRSKEIFRLVKKVSFDNPNKLEENLQIFDNFPRHKMASNCQSSLVNIPTNILEGLETEILLEELNKEYINGNTIDLNSIDFKDINGCVKELNFKLIKL